MEKNTRLNKFFSEIGYCSRRSADKLIEQGRVLINGQTAIIGQKINKSDSIEVDGKQIDQKINKNIYIAFNKPKGIVCTTDTRVEKNNIIDFIDYPSRIFPIGRLDKASEGLILLTNDGDIVNKILRSRNEHEKEYIVTVNKPITKEFIKRMGSGVPILDTITKKCLVKQTHKKKFKIILTQGINRQIRRMCEYFEYRVLELKRIRIMNINLDTETGTYRNLSKEEIKFLKTITENSKKNN
tara:strand:- start:6341 stop:7063 length:723 start_codon:yes stop_codon:yes gene_type:complete